MTDSVPPSIDAGKTFEGKSIWLPQFALKSLRAGHLVLDGFTFRDCTIEGPAVLTAVSNVFFDSCDMGAAQEVADLFLTPRGPRITGTVAFSNTRFVNCRFVMVGFTGDERFISSMVDSVVLSGDS